MGIVLALILYPLFKNVFVCTCHAIYQRDGMKNYYKKKKLFDYEILDRLEAGIVLTGDEVKSLRAGHVNLTGTFANIHKGELFMVNLSYFSHEKAYIKDEDAPKRLT